MVPLNGRGAKEHVTQRKSMSDQKRKLEAIFHAAREGSPLKLVPLPHLIAPKLYAGGHKSKADIIELLARNPDLDLDETRAICRRYRLNGLDELIREALE